MPPVRGLLMVLCAFLPIGALGACMECKHTTVHRMQTADCYGRDLTKVPQCLNTNIRILELTHNRIRRIKKADLAQYSSLEMLYLTDNMISKIDESAFESLTGLTVLDLSLNSLIKIPEVIFHLPSLKKLYLSQNLNINVAEVIEQAKPITSPLEVLDISENELPELPDIGIIPTLVVYNISGNKLDNISLHNIAGLCNLKIFANANFTAEFQSPCECWKMVHWMREKNIKFQPLNCPVDEDACIYEDISEEESMYKECQGRYDVIVLQSKLLTIGLPVAIVIIVIVIIIVFVLLRRRRSSKNRRKYSRRITSLSTKEDQGELIYQ